MSWGGSRDTGKHLWSLIEHWEPVRLEINETIEVMRK